MKSMAGTQFHIHITNWIIKILALKLIVEKDQGLGGLIDKAKLMHDYT